MNRYKYILNQSVANELQIGLFPYGTLIDPTLTNVKTETLTFFDSATEFFNKLKIKNISVVLFINQFKKHPVSFEELQKFTEAVESHVRAQGVKVTGMYWAPGSESKDPFVVPNPGMFYRVTENTGLKWDNIPVLSASDNDLSAAKKVNAIPIKIGDKHQKFDSFNSLIEWIDKQ
jgi:histidinol phosphatase-like enzyme